MKVIAHIQNGYKTKFAIPRQSGIADSVVSRIVFEPEYRNADALRGMDGFSHLWLIWEFSETVCDKWRPTVRPPRLGGNKRMGVFATRSPFRPNPIGLSAVRLENIEYGTQDGPVIYVSGADLMNGTPIYDIKPYLAFADSHPDAKGGFASEVEDYRLEVCIPDEFAEKIPPEHIEAVRDVLANDPRPSYHNDDKRVYGFEIEGMEIKFTVADGVVHVCGAELNI